MQLISRLSRLCLLIRQRKVFPPVSLADSTRGRIAYPYLELHAQWYSIYSDIRDNMLSNDCTGTGHNEAVSASTSVSDDDDIKDGGLRWKFGPG